MASDDLSLIFKGVMLIIGAILPVINPLGDAPIFLMMTSGSDFATRTYLAKRIALYAFALLLAAMIFGSHVLALFGISIPLVQVGGGAIVCGLAWSIVSNQSDPSEKKLTPDQAKSTALGRVITPLTLPLTVDAGAIAVAVTVGSVHFEGVELTFIRLIAAVIGCAIIALSILLTYKYAEIVCKKLGPAITTILIQGAAFILLCIGLGISWEGIKALLRQVGIHQ